MMLTVTYMLLVGATFLSPHAPKSAMPPPTGAVSRTPLAVEKSGAVQQSLAFEGTYPYPFAYSLVCFKSHVAGYGWKREHEIVLAKDGAGAATAVALSFTNSSERLSAALSQHAVRKTGVQYQIETKEVKR